MDLYILDNNQIGIDVLGVGRIIFYVPPIISGQWYYLVCIKNATTNESTVYLNGIQSTSGYQTISSRTWIQNMSAPSSVSWSSVAISSSGDYQTAVSNGYIYTSSNYGQTWDQNASAPNLNWQSVSMSSLWSISNCCG